MSTKTRLPTSDYADGSWVRNGGYNTDIYSYVDDPIGSADGNTTSMYTLSSESQCLFGFSAFDVPTGSTSISLSLTAGAKLSGTGTNHIHGAVRVNGTVYASSASSNLTGSYVDYTFTWSTNPNTGADWTVADINGSGSNPLQYFGIIGNGVIASYWPIVTQVYLTATYTEAASVIASGFAGPGIVIGKVSMGV